MPVFGARFGYRALVVGVPAPVVIRFLCSAAAARVVAQSFSAAGLGEATIYDKFSAAPYSSECDPVTPFEQRGFPSQEDSMRKQLSLRELSMAANEENGREKVTMKVRRATQSMCNGLQTLEKSTHCRKQETAFQQLEQEAVKGLKGFGVFEKIPSVKTRSLIHEYCSKGEISQALDVLEEMYKQKLGLTHTTFNPILNRFSEQFMLNEAFETLAMMRRMKVEPTIENYNIVIRGCAKSGNMEKAYGCLAELHQHGIKPVSKSFNYIVKGFCELGRFKRAKSVVREMVQAGCKPNKHIYHTLLLTCVRNRNSSWALKVIEEMSREGLETKDVIPVVMNAFHMGSGKLDNAIKAVNELETKGNGMGLGLKNQLLLELTRTGHLDEAHKVYQDLRTGGKCLLQGSAFTLLAAYGKTGKLDRMAEIFEDSFSKPLKRDCSNHYVTVSCIHMVLSFIQHNQLGQAVNFLQLITERGMVNDVVLFDKIFLHIASSGSDGSSEDTTDISDGLAVLEVMRKLDIRPSRVALEALLDCCYSLPGNLGKVLEIVQEMEKECLPLNIFSKIRLFRIFLTARNESEALRVLNQMSSDDLSDPDVQMLLLSILELSRNDHRTEGENGSLEETLQKQVHRLLNDT